MTTQREAIRPTTRFGEANLFETSGPIVISYSRSSLAGVPLLSYADGERSVRFSGDEITRTEVAIGELVTVTLEQVIDAFVRTFSLLVPTVQLNQGDLVEFDAVGIETIDTRGAFVPAPGPEGVLATYRLHDLHGTAQFVSF